MSTDPTESELTPEQKAAQEADARAEQLTDELAKKYDPERLLRIVSRRAGRGQMLDQAVRAKYEKRFGVDLGHVRVYTGEFAEEFNRKRNAYAVTIGSTGMILMGGSPDKSMASQAGQALLAHELTHVAQANRGLHNKNFAGAMPLATEEHEEEAEEIEAEILAGGTGDGTSLSHEAKTAVQKGKLKLEAAMEKVKNQVMQMAGESARNEFNRATSPKRS